MYREIFHFLIKVWCATESDIWYSRELHIHNSYYYCYQLGYLHSKCVDTK